MPDLHFEVIGAESPAFAAVPTLIFKLRITNADAQYRIHNVALRSQIQIAVAHRHYSPQAQQRLQDVFGEAKRWNSTLRTLLWTHVSTIVPFFTDEIVVDLPLTCTYDFEVVSTKYLSALEDGNIPLEFLFSGSIFYEEAEGNIQIAPIPWSKEASYQLAVALWHQTMQRYYPNTAWITLHKDIFDQLYQYKVTCGFPTWEEAISRLLYDSTKEAHS